MSAQESMEKIKHFAGLAVHFDRQGNANAAAYYYLEASRLITLESDKEELKPLYSKALEYKQRSEELSLLASKEENVIVPENRMKETSDLERGGFLLKEALEDDEAGNYKDALENYKEAVDLCLKASNSTENKDLKKKLTDIATRALDRGEEVKEILEKLKCKEERTPSSEAAQSRIKFDYLNLRDDDSGVKPSENPKFSSGYSDEEKKVLAVTSMINGREYVPFMSVDLKERFAFPVPYTDKHGNLKLSTKQSSKLSRWARPDEFISNPRVLEIVDCFSVKQTVVSDCSFVASIAISAQYEKRFKKKLITNSIFPQNKKGEPVYNPCGKYMVVLRINGVPRKVILDDYFPLGHHNEMLCSYSSNKSELWISLLEKAYMKVMGGYDFPGSNSNIDLYALTGWIPERTSIKQKDDSFKKDEVFRKLFQRFHKGDVLVTLATGEMSDAEAERAGLVPTHAYAMLDIREVNGIRLFLLKNPWAHLRWKGNYSETDNRNWTPDMMKALSYDPKNAQNFDNGVFWIDYDSLCRFFDVFYMNWNPELFKYSYAVHHLWNAGKGPAKDMYNISANPQYSLEINERGSGAIWVLLSRHITEIDDFKDNKEYITLLVYKKDGQKVYYPYGPDPLIDGVRINSPHYLCKIPIDDKMPRKLTLVVSQYEKSTTIYYTCRVYSTLPFHLKRIQDPYKSKQEITGAWKGKSAGGCGNYRDTYQNNPRYQFGVQHETQLLIELKGPKQYQIGFDLVCVFISSDLKNSPKYFKMKPSGAYRTGYVMMAIELLPGTYDIVPTTFRPGQEGPFFLTLSSCANIKAQKIQ